MFQRLIAFFLFSLMLLPLVSADQEASSWNQENSPAWEYDFGTGYISTSPVFVDDKIIVRTSGNSEPSVTALELDGTMMWKHANLLSKNNDMSPVLPVNAGEGICGTWPDLLLVGWTNGVIDALHPSNGTVYWSTQTEVAGWGITGAAIVSEDHVIFPTRRGVGQFCLADGSQEWWAETGLGWRNGVSLHNGSLYSGDELGTLWQIDSSGNTTSLATFDGKIRHAPLMTQAGLLIHVQSSMSSTVYILDPVSGEERQQIPAGPSPAMPVLNGQYAVVADSMHLQMMKCAVACTVVSQIPFHTNGEIGWQNESHLIVPHNTPDSNWGSFVFDGGQNLTLELIDTGITGYGTAAPLWFSSNGMNYTVFGNDQSLLRVYQSNYREEVEVTKDIDWVTQGFVFTAYVLLASSAVFFLNGKKELFLRTSSLLLVLILLLILPELSQVWSEAVDQALPESSTSEVWDEQWPDSWLGTQIVIFEIDGEETAVGGFVGYENVFSVTKAAADEVGFSLSVEQTGIGMYISSIDGVEGNGWEYDLDGSKGRLSADNTVIESTSIVRWTPV